MKNSSPNQHPMDRHLKKLSSKGSSNNIYREYIGYQFESVFEPSYFGTICWNPFVFQFEEAVKDTQHFKNKLFTGIHNCKPYQVPDLPNRPRVIFFQEVKEVLTNPNSSHPKYRRTFHTHFHLGGSHLVSGVSNLDAIIQERVRPGFNRLLRRDTEENRAVVIKPWNREFHLFYNIKDYYSNQYMQDGDLVIDYENSDLG